MIEQAQQTREDASKRLAMAEENMRIARHDHTYAEATHDALLRVTTELEERKTDPGTDVMPKRDW